MQPDFVVLVVVVPPEVVVTVSVFPTLQPLATKAASNAPERMNERLPSKLKFNLFSHAMILFPIVNILKTKYSIFIVSNQSLNVNC
jgi:hypothetical protein